MTPKKLFVFFATAEAITWTLLISVLVTRAVTEIPSVAVTIVGGTHGAVFLGYGVTAALVGVNQRWALGRIIGGIALAIVPYATVPFERAAIRRGLVEGDWRTTTTSDPRDAHWFDRLFRWFIAKPVLLVITLLAVVAAIFTVLVSLGPPTEWFNR
jgi:integral membrane protein